MDIATLQAQEREAKGTRAARRLRREGKVPGIIYGQGQTPENVAIDAHDVLSLLERGTHLLELAVGKKKRQVLIRDVQFDHLGIAPVHVDFTLVDLTDRVHVSVPLEFRGTPVGTHEGGVLDQSMVDIEIECVVTQIPESVRVNVADMKMGDMLHVRDLELPEGVKAMSSPEAIVCSVRAATAAAEVEAAEVVGEEGAPAEPEIIGRKEKESEEEEAE